MKEKLNFISNWLEVKSPTYKNLNKDMKDLPFWYKLTSAATAGFLVGAAVNGCTSPTVSSEQTNNNGNAQEFTPTPESDLYPATFAWLDGRNETVQKVATEYGLPISNIKGFEITVSGLISATGVREEKVQFVNFTDPTTGINMSAYYDSKNPDGLLNDFETVNRGGGLFVERQLVDSSNPDNHHTLLIIPVDAEQKLKSGQSTTLEFNPPEWIRAYMPALDPDKNLIVNVPLIPELTTTASIGFIPEFLVTDGTVEGVQTPTPTESPEPTLPAEVMELQKSLDGTNYAFAWNNDLKSISLTYTNPETEEKFVIPEIVFDEKGNWKRTYTFETPYGTEAEVTIDSRVDKMTVIETPDGKKILDFSAWSLIDGKWVREYKQDTEVPNHNVAEAQFMIINNGSQDVKDGIHTNSSQFDTKENAKTYMNAMFPNINVTNGLINYQGVQDFRNAEAVMPIWFGPGIWLRDEDLKRVEVDTTFYVNMNLTSGDAAIIYRDKNREYQIIFINANLDDMRNWSPAFVVAHPFD